MPFTDLGVTRRKVTTLPTQAWVAGSTLTFPLPRVGLLARIYLAIRGSYTSTAASTVSAFGFSSVIRRTRVNINSGIDVFSVSGPGYAYLVARTSTWQGRSAMVLGQFNIDQIIPIAVNLRDPVGLIMLQNEQTLVTLNVDCETQANSAGAGAGSTVNAVAITPYIEWFTVPSDTKNWPNLNNIHQILEDQVPIGAAGLVQYNWPRGNTYLSMIHGVTANTAALAATGFVDTALTTGSIQIRQNQSDFIQSTDLQTNQTVVMIPFLDMIHGLTRGTNRITGVIPFDLMSTAGLGFYDQMRDVINSALVTDLASVMTFNATGTLYSVRRQLVPLVQG